MSLLPPEIHESLPPEMGGGSSPFQKEGAWWGGDREMDLVLTVLKLRLLKLETN